MGGLSRDRVRGCLLGGAIGDALGANIEFLSLHEIRREFGPAGVTSYVGGSYPAGSITDDTQMTLFTAEGLIRARKRQVEHGVWAPAPVIRGAYLRWLATQEYGTPTADEWLASGWLVHEEVLHARRAPGATCVSALREGGEGSLDLTINDSKGCGGVMRVAPAGVMESPEAAFEVAAEAAAITHTHPTGYLASGTLAAIVQGLLHDQGLDESIERALAELRGRANSGETVDAIARAPRPGRRHTAARRDRGAAWRRMDRGGGAHDRDVLRACRGLAARRCGWRSTTAATVTARVPSAATSSAPRAGSARCRPNCSSTSKLAT